MGKEIVEEYGLTIGRMFDLDDLKIMQQLSFLEF